MKKIDFLATDGLKLNGLLYESNQKTDKVILSVHGMSSNCLKNREDILSKCMNQNNIDYFCFNNRGSELVRYIQKDINGEKEIYYFTKHMKKIMRFILTNIKKPNI